MTPRLLDLFCGAGGAARGYQRAGFYVVGVDVHPQPHYCGDELHQDDALDVLADLVTGDWLESFDAIHASPPCQHYANVTQWRGNQADHPDLIPETRRQLLAWGGPFIIENVRTNALESPFVLCGSMFGLRVIRHRYFESNAIPFSLMPTCNHTGAMAFEHKHERAYADAMGCDWMSAVEARQAIPPAYTEWIGARLMAYQREDVFL